MTDSLEQRKLPSSIKWIIAAAEVEVVVVSGARMLGTLQEDASQQELRKGKRSTSYPPIDCQSNEENLVSASGTYLTYKH